MRRIDYYLGIVLFAVVIVAGEAWMNGLKAEATARTVKAAQIDTHELVIRDDQGEPKMLVHCLNNRPSVMMEDGKSTLLLEMNDDHHPSISLWDGHKNPRLFIDLDQNGVGAITRVENDGTLSQPVMQAAPSN